LLSAALFVVREKTRAWMRHVECIDTRVMTAREHHALRAFGVLLLAIAALWPRSHATHHDSAVARHAIRGQFTTAAARPSADDVPRPRNARVVVDDVDESQLRN
jgi:hypothetical protein